MSDLDDARAMVTIESLVGVYHANGSIGGELRYWIGARLGRAHCSLCDITHGTFTEKDGWKTCRAALPVPFDTVHLDERDPAVRDFTEGATPAVVARTDQGLRLLLGPDDLEGLDGDPNALVQALTDAAARMGLTWPS
jgi:hypothetical protein